MNRISKIADKIAGTWSIPDSSIKVEKLVRIVKEMDRGNWPMGENGDINNILYDLIGDDDLYDKIDRIRRSATVGGMTNDDDYLKSTAKEIRKKLGEWVKGGIDSFKYPKDYEFIIRAARMLGVK